MLFQELLVFDGKHHLDLCLRKAKNIHHLMNFAYGSKVFNNKWNNVLICLLQLVSNPGCLLPFQ
jgi:hypothetical protein